MLLGMPVIRLASGAGLGRPASEIVKTKVDKMMRGEVDPAKCKKYPVVPPHGSKLVHFY